ncbi:hypothetical protein GP486_001542 [Trichoglossum hirsutum]|uniref:BBC1/AIM3 cysteine proteinase-fold domain-containing protein n=1 Tax=Trichoglossum hirsutum TaxID=265104 RepID=A0A9P8LFW9_9PEZI|nr:hypothetical protein GP486_001542 [Trichoglossum hirsutum]
MDNSQQSQPKVVTKLAPRNKLPSPITSSPQPISPPAPNVTTSTTNQSIPPPDVATFTLPPTNQHSPSSFVSPSVVTSILRPTQSPTTTRPTSQLNPATSTGPPNVAAPTLRSTNPQSPTSTGSSSVVTTTLRPTQNATIARPTGGLNPVTSTGPPNVITPTFRSTNPQSSTTTGPTNQLSHTTSMATTPQSNQPSHEEITLTFSPRPLENAVRNLREDDEDPQSLGSKLFEENSEFYVDIITKTQDVTTIRNSTLQPKFFGGLNMEFPQQSSAATFSDGKTKCTITMACRSRRNLRVTKVKLTFISKSGSWTLLGGAEVCRGPPTPRRTRQELDGYRKTYGQWISKWLEGQKNKQLENGECTMLVKYAIMAFSQEEKQITPPLQTMLHNHGFCLYKQHGTPFDADQFTAANIGPGDVIQYHNGADIDDRPHTAVIIEVIRVGVVKVLHQNAGSPPNKTVHEAENDLVLDKMGRWYEIYRIMPRDWVEECNAKY